jgi:hypothetical protein
MTKEDAFKAEDIFFNILFIYSPHKGTKNLTESKKGNASCRDV